MWQVWRPRFPQWNGLLCPILFADRFGLVVVMRRAHTPVAREDFIPLDQRPYPDTTTEVNPGNVGWLDGRVVEIVYGLASEDIISKRRAYYAERARHAWRHRVGRRCV